MSRKKEILGMITDIEANPCLSEDDTLDDMLEYLRSKSRQYVQDAQYCKNQSEKLNDVIKIIMNDGAQDGN